MKKPEKEKSQQQKNKLNGKVCVNLRIANYKNFFRLLCSGEREREREREREQEFAHRKCHKTFGRFSLLVMIRK